MVRRDHTVDRRTVLKNLAVGGAVAAGVGSGSAAARTAAPTSPRGPTIADVQTHIGDVATVEQVVRDAAGPLAEALADHGYLDSAAKPPVESFVGTAEFVETSADAVATAGPGLVDDAPVVSVRVRQVTADHEIVYYLLPFGDDDGYAFVTPIEGGTTTAVEPGVGTYEVRAQQCTGGSLRCTDKCDCSNGQFYTTRERCECECTPDGLSCVCGWVEDGCECRESVHTCPK